MNICFHRESYHCGSTSNRLDLDIIVFMHLMMSSSVRHAFVTQAQFGPSQPLVFSVHTKALGLVKRNQLHVQDRKKSSCLEAKFYFFPFQEKKKKWGWRPEEELVDLPKEKEILFIERFLIQLSLKDLLKMESVGLHLPHTPMPPTWLYLYDLAWHTLT